MRISGWVVPVLVALAALIGIGGARVLAAPSLTRDFPGAAPADPETVLFVVSGLKCVDTARILGGQFEDQPGVRRFVAYASRNQAWVTYDAAVTDPRAIRAAIEAAVVDTATGQITFHQFEVVSIDGRRLQAIR